MGDEGWLIDSISSCLLKILKILLPAEVEMFKGLAGIQSTQPEEDGANHQSLAGRVRLPDGCIADHTCNNVRFIHTCQ